MPIFTPVCNHEVEFCDLESTRALETQLQNCMPPHALMGKAGLSVAHLGKAISPHARQIWIACGPGNNGGDGLVAAIHVREWMQTVGGALWVTLEADEASLPDDARWALDEAKRAGVTFSEPPADVSIDLGVDALLGIGTYKPRTTEPSPIQRRMSTLRSRCATLLCVDTPSDLDPFTGAERWPGSLANPSQEVQTLTMLTFKPGLTTGAGRDLAGSVWLAPLAPDSAGVPTGRWLPPGMAWPNPNHRHCSHKGTNGDVWIVGGQTSQGGAHMLGAIVLAGRSALAAGAGRATLVPVGATEHFQLDPTHPEVMVSHQPHHHVLQQGTWVAGCGGGTAIRDWIPHILTSSNPAVFDADALNQIAGNITLQETLGKRRQNGAITVLTPHPLEAARLLGTSTEAVQRDRLKAAKQLSERFQCICVLKGSGTVISSPDSLPWVNGTGNARLSTAGTGDVLAGLLGGVIAKIPNSLNREGRWQQALETTIQVVHAHGLAADNWPADCTFTTSALPNRVGCLLHGRP